MAAHSYHTGVLSHYTYLRVHCFPGKAEDLPLCYQVVSANSGSTGHSSMEASQSPSVANSGDLLRQSSTVSTEARNGSGALQVLRAAAVRADKWKAANVDGHAGRLSVIMHCFCFHARSPSPATSAV